ncbi:bHLHZip transcription factor BIGMAX [Handroanthus impetiginosus]|uniref:BHLHZip transcription factor BIGMAX n=1 Tax=Handroanthus impetiginosus TaxID=429701 RepID=A0A2G9GLU8_9LAMI|nr:bHLHZip transcription factor BIGMAX [Handroanthus impetiginosus]
MAALEAGLDWLRPLINTNPWDFCVIWKLGDDPSRFIEWVTCCCSGGNKAEIIKTTDEDDLERHLIVECKDKFVKHPVRTKACKKVAELPSVIPLYSGIHGDVVISEQPRWTSDYEPNGTQVLVPVTGGLIELFSTQNVPKDQKIIDYISARFRVSFKKENMHNLEDQLCDPHSNDYWPTLVHNLNFLPHLSQPNNYSSFEGSSTCSSLSNEHQILKLDSDHKPSSNPRLKRKKNTDFALVSGNEKAGVKIRQKAEKGPYKSKNLVTERNRRKRIKDGMFALRALVPKISKMDRASTLGDAAEYIKELEETIENYRQELRAMEEEDYDRVNGKPDVTKLITDNKSDVDEKTSTEVQVEVSQLGPKGFLLRLICHKKRGGFSRLMEAMDSLGLQVTDANVTTLNGSVLNVLKVEAGTMQIEPNTLKDSLIQLAN